MSVTTRTALVTGASVRNGAFCNRLTLAEPAPLVRDRKSVGRLWKLTSRLVGLA